MTAHSTNHDRSTALAQHGSTLAKLSPAPLFEVPPQVATVLWLNAEGDYWREDALKRLAHAKRQGCIDAIPALAERATAALAPIPRQSLIDRLTMLGMSMTNGKDAEQIKIWLHETARLLEDLPECVLLPAIDECVKEPGRVFVPSVGEIRAKAEPQLRKIQRQAARLNRLKQMLAEDVEIPDVPPEPPRWGETEKRTEPNCTPEEAAAILAEFGLKSSFGSSLAGMLKPEEPKTTQQMAAEGREMPRPLRPSDSWDLLP